LDAPRTARDPDESGFGLAEVGLDFGS